MKKSKKIIIPVIFILIIIIVWIVIHQNKTNSNTIETSNKTSSTNSGTNIDDTYKSNFSGENAVIYLGTHSQYEPFTIVLNKTLSNEDLAKSIVSKISTLIGYKIKLNSITFNDKNIYINFSNEYAPFNIENSYIESEEKLYSIYGNENIVYTIFNSIYKSLKSYFGNDYNIYFSSNSENINISINEFSFKVDASTPYILEE